MEQRSEEWFNARRGRITASSVGAILGQSPHRTRSSILRTMVRQHHGLDDEFRGNPATEWGVANEANAIGAYEMWTGRAVRKCGFFPKGDRYGASPDGIVGNNGIIEIKCPYAIRMDPEPVEFKSIKDQRHYFSQVQFQMWATDSHWCDFFQWTVNDFKLEEVERDGEYIEWMLAELAEFWAEFQAAIADPDEHLEDVYGVVDTPRARQMVEEYDQLTEAMERATERRKELLGEMVAMAGHRKSHFGGRKLIQINKDGAVSYANVVKEMLPKLDLTKWRGKPSSYWQLK